MSQISSQNLSKKSQTKSVANSDLNPTPAKYFSPGPGAYDIPGTISSQGYSFGAYKADELKTKLGYDPLHIEVTK